jgi:hypothetical protein
MTKRRKNAGRLLIISLGIGIAFNFLFWGTHWGINYPIGVALVLGIGFWQAKQLGIQMHRNNRILLGIAIIFPLITLWRREPFSLFINSLVVLLALFTLTVAFVKGRWPEFRLLDYISRFSLIPFHGWTSYRTQRTGDAKSRRQITAAIGRGLLLALPILIVLSALLASADYVFAEWLENIFAWLRIENFVEFIWRAIWIVAIATISLLVFSYAFFQSGKNKLVKDGKELFAPFLGFIETAMVLGSVIALFSVFVAIQFRYFFGGILNINTAGFTYADYARRGFAELVVVSVISVALYMMLSIVGKRINGREQKMFSFMSIALLGLVSVMLISAFQRLVLYEEIYGFTRTRTNVHIFMVLLGLFFIALILAEFRQERRNFTRVLIATLLIFGLVLPIVNVDAFVVRANIDIYQNEDVIDVAYLGGLSENGLQALWGELDGLPFEKQTPVLAAIGCYQSLNDFDHFAWQNINFAGNSVEASMTNEYQSRMKADFTDEYGTTMIIVDGEEFVCQSYYYE